MHRPQRTKSVLRTDGCVRHSLMSKRIRTFLSLSGFGWGATRKKAAQPSSFCRRSLKVQLARAFFSGNKPVSSPPSAELWPFSKHRFTHKQINTARFRHSTTTLDASNHFSTRFLLVLFNFLCEAFPLVAFWINRKSFPNLTFVILITTWYLGTAGLPRT